MAQDNKDNSPTKFDKIMLLNSARGGYWTPWPHEFNRLMRLYPSVPNSFWITLLHVWGATVGSVDGESGLLAMSQIPARAKDGRKWIEAMTAAGFFRRVAAKQGDKEGSAFYLTRPESSAADWEVFLEVLGWVVEWGGLSGEVTAKRFGKLVGAAMQNPQERAVRKLFRKR